MYNPGEPVFDQKTGEPFIDPDGNLVEVAPGLTVAGPNGRSLDGDDVANAAFYRVNKFEGETLRDINIGVPYQSALLGQGNAVLVMQEMAGEIRAQTPGVIGIVQTKIISYDPRSRILLWSGILIRANGDEQSVKLQAGG
jgi:hypothetical protein